MKHKLPSNRELAAEIGRRIRQVRDKRGMTNRELADAIGATESMVSNWINGNVNVSGPYLVSLTEELAISGHWLLTGAGPMEWTDEAEAQTRLAQARETAAILNETLSGKRARKGKIR